MERLFFGDSSNKFVSIEFLPQEIKLLESSHLKFIHQLRNKNLGVAYSFGGLYPSGYKLITEFKDLLDIIVLDRLYNRDELQSLTEAGFARESLKRLRQRYPGLIFYGDLDPDILTIQLYGHVTKDGFDGFILDNGCFVGPTQGKILLETPINIGNIDVSSSVGLSKLPFDVMANILLPLTYEEILTKCKTNKEFNSLCNSEEFWKRYAQDRGYKKTKNNQTWKEVVEYEQIIKSKYGGSYDPRNSTFIYRSPYSIQNNIKLTKQEKEKIADQLTEDLSTIPVIANAEDLSFNFNNDFEVRIKIPNLNTNAVKKLQQDIDELLKDNIQYDIRRGNSLYAIYFD